MTEETKFDRAKLLRRQQTKPESLLWELLRAKQLCGLKFRRQHPIGPYFADFACVSARIVVELDGGYHDQTCDYDVDREACLKKLGWQVIRFSNDEVLSDAESVTIAIARMLDVEYKMVRRAKSNKGDPSGSHYSPPSQREG